MPLCQPREHPAPCVPHPNHVLVCYSLRPQWEYFQYSTYTRMEYRIKKASDGSQVATGTIAGGDIGSPTATSRRATLPLTSLRGRFTIEVRMASEQGTSAYSPPTSVFAAGERRQPKGAVYSMQPKRGDSGGTGLVSAKDTKLSFPVPALHPSTRLALSVNCRR